MGATAFSEEASVRVDWGSSFGVLRDAVLLSGGDTESAGDEEDVELSVPDGLCFAAAVELEAAPAGF